MSWKFWQKNSENEASPAAGTKLPGPRNIPESVGRYMVVKMKKDPDWVWGLEAVLRPRSEGKHVFDVRVFDVNEAASKNISVKNFNSLDACPELILFEGWFDKKNNQVESRPGPLSSSQAA